MKGDDRGTYLAGDRGKFATGRFRFPKKKGQEGAVKKGGNRSKPTQHRKRFATPWHKVGGTRSTLQEIRGGGVKFIRRPIGRSGRRGGGGVCRLPQIPVSDETKPKASNREQKKKRKRSVRSSHGRKVIQYCRGPQLARRRQYHPRDTGISPARKGKPRKKGQDVY